MNLKNLVRYGREIRLFPFSCISYLVTIYVPSLCRCRFYLICGFVMFGLARVEPCGEAGMNKLALILVPKKVSLKQCLGKLWSLFRGCPSGLDLGGTLKARQAWCSIEPLS
jgi:hypothetical protein